NCCTNWPMFTPCWPSAGPTGGAGVAWPPGHWSLIFAVISFAISVRPFRRSRHRCQLDALHLPVFQFHRRGATEDLHHDTNQPLALQHLVHTAFEILERAFLNLNRLALLKIDLEPWLILGLGRGLPQHL